MNLYIHEWIAYLRDTHGAAAFPLLVGGLALTIFGWRMWKLCVVLAFAVIGGGVALSYLPESPDRWLFVAGAAVVVGVVSYWPARHLVTLLGGLIGGGAVMAYLGELGLKGAPLWCLAGAGLVISCAYALIYREKVVVLITAFLGSALVVSGLIALVMTTPSIHGWFSGLASESAIFAPFLLLVPTVMSCFYQMGEAKRIRMGV